MPGINRNYLIHHSDEGWPWRGSILALHIARFFSILLGAVTLWADLPDVGAADRRAGRFAGHSPPCLYPAIHLHQRGGQQRQRDQRPGHAGDVAVGRPGA